jgi:hypothetical protein
MIRNDDIRNDDDIEKTYRMVEPMRAITEGAQSEAVTSRINTLCDGVSEQAGKRISRNWNSRNGQREPDEDFLTAPLELLSSREETGELTHSLGFALPEQSPNTASRIESAVLEPNYSVSEHSASERSDLSHPWYETETDIYGYCFRPGSEFGHVFPQYPALVDGKTVGAVMCALDQLTDTWLLQTLAAPLPSSALSADNGAPDTAVMVELKAIVFQEDVSAAGESQLHRALSGIPLAPFRLSFSEPTLDFVAPYDEFLRGVARQVIDSRIGMPETYPASFVVPQHFLNSVILPPGRQLSLKAGLGGTVSPLDDIPTRLLNAINTRDSVYLGSEPNPGTVSEPFDSPLMLCAPHGTNSVVFLDPTEKSIELSNARHQRDSLAHTVRVLTATSIRQSGPTLILTTDADVGEDCVRIWYSAAKRSTDVAEDPEPLYLTGDTIEQNLISEREGCWKVLEHVFEGKRRLCVLDLSGLKNSGGKLAWLAAMLSDIAQKHPDQFNGGTLVGCSPALLSGTERSLDDLEVAIQNACQDGLLAAFCAKDTCFESASQPPAHASGSDGRASKTNDSTFAFTLTEQAASVLKTSDVVLVDERTQAAKLLTPITPDQTVNVTIDQTPSNSRNRLWQAYISGEADRPPVTLPIKRSSSPVLDILRTSISETQEAVVSDVLTGTPEAVFEDIPASQAPDSRSPAAPAEVEQYHARREFASSAPVAQATDEDGYVCTVCDDTTVHPDTTAGLKAALSCCRSTSDIDRGAVRQAPHVRVPVSDADVANSDLTREQLQYLGLQYLAAIGELDRYLEYDVLLDSATSLRDDAGLTPGDTTELIETGYLTEYIGRKQKRIHALTDKGLAAIKQVEAPTSDAYQPVPERALTRAGELALQKIAAAQPEHTVHRDVSIKITATRSFHPSSGSLDIAVTDATGDVVHGLNVVPPTTPAGDGAETNTEPDDAATQVDLTSAYLGMCSAEPDTACWAVWDHQEAANLCTTLAEAGKKDIIEYSGQAPEQDNPRIQYLNESLDEQGITEIQSLKHLCDRIETELEQHRRTGRLEFNGGEDA